MVIVLSKVYYHCISGYICGMVANLTGYTTGGYDSCVSRDIQPTIAHQHAQAVIGIDGAARNVQNTGLRMINAIRNIAGSGNMPNQRTAGNVNRGAAMVYLAVAGTVSGHSSIIHSGDHTVIHIQNGSVSIHADAVFPRQNKSAVYCSS